MNANLEEKFVNNFINFLVQIGNAINHINNFHFNPYIKIIHNFFLYWKTILPLNS